jgi:putative spermidine/putrescine transport system ATP-binding protein
MSARLDVRDLWVLFAGPPHPSPIDGSVRTLMVDADTESMRRAAPGHRVGLPEVTFTVDAGQCLAVLGTSGAGKSSLLRTLAGLQPQGRGRISVNGRDVSTLPAEQRSVVYLHQEPVLFPHLSVLENVAFPLSVRGISRREAERRGVEMLGRLGVGGVAGNAASALSGGQRHRVALARALCADPAVLLLDEPLASLDPAVRQDVRAALIEARAVSGAATILVTHDLDDAMAVATHIAAIGRVGDLSVPMSPADLLRDPPTLAVAQLLGVFAEVPGVVERTDDGAPRFRWVGGAMPAPRVAPGSAVACVRSHDVEVNAAGASEAPVLTVTARRDAAHEVMLDLSDPSGGLVTLRAPSLTAARAGDQVQLTLRHARIYSTP